MASALKLFLDYVSAVASEITVCGAKDCQSATGLSLLAMYCLTSIHIRHIYSTIAFHDIYIYKPPYITHTLEKSRFFPHSLCYCKTTSIVFVVWTGYKLKRSTEKTFLPKMHTSESVAGFCILLIKIKGVQSLLLSTSCVPPV